MGDGKVTRKRAKQDEEPSRINEKNPITRQALEWYDANVFTLRRWASHEKERLPFQNMMALIAQSVIITREEVSMSKVCPVGYKAKRNSAHYITHLAEDKYELSKIEFEKVMLFAQYARQQRGYFLEIGLSWLVVLKDYQVSSLGFVFAKRAEWKLSADSEAMVKTGYEIWDILDYGAKEAMHVVAAATAMSSKLDDKSESWVTVFDGVTHDNLIERLLPVQHVTSGSIASLVSVLTVCAFADLDHAKLASLIKDYGLIQSKEVLKISALASFRTPDKTQCLHLARAGAKLDVGLVSELPDDCFVPLSNVRFTHTSVEALAGPHYRVFYTPQPVAELFNLVGKNQYQKISGVTYVSGETVKSLARKVKPELVGGKAPAANEPPNNATDNENAEWAD